MMFFVSNSDIDRYVIWLYTLTRPMQHPPFQAQDRLRAVATHKLNIKCIVCSINEVVPVQLYTYKVLYLTKAEIIALRLREFSYNSVVERILLFEFGN